MEPFSHSQLFVLVCWHSDTDWFSFTAPTDNNSSNRCDFFSKFQLPPIGVFSYMNVRTKVQTKACVFVTLYTFNPDSFGFTISLAQLRFPVLYLLLRQVAASTSIQTIQKLLMNRTMVQIDPWWLWSEAPFTPAIPIPTKLKSPNQSRSTEIWCEKHVFHRDIVTNNRARVTI